MKPTSLAMAIMCTLFVPWFGHANTLIGATYLGGSGEEGWQWYESISVAVHQNGNIYIAGITSSSNFPVTSGAYSEIKSGGADLFVACLSPDLSTLVSATFVGGSGDESYPQIAINPFGRVILAGITTSSDYPATSGAYQTTMSGVQDVCISVLTEDLSDVLASTFVGGSGSEDMVSLATDGVGNIFISGSVPLSDYPTVAGSYDTTFNGGDSDFFVSKLSSNLSSLVASTYLGGRYREMWPIVGVDDAGYVYVSGGVESDDFPTTPGAYDQTFNGPPVYVAYQHDIGLSKLSNDLTTMISSTYIGTSAFEAAQIMTVRTDGVVYVGGHTDNADYPVTSGALDESHGGMNEYFITRVDSSLSEIEASTFLTPGIADFAFMDNITLDPNGRVVISGTMGAPGRYPVPSGSCDDSFNGGANDLFLLVLDESLTSTEYAAYLGGSSDDYDLHLATGPQGSIYVAGLTTSTNATTTPGAFSGVYAGGLRDLYVALISTDGCCGIWTSGFTGNANCSIDGKLTLSDITRLIDHVYISKEPLCCQAAGNANGSEDCKTTLSDITRLIDAVYISKAQPMACMLECEQ